MAQCSFCDNPAAHPATGCEYGPDTLACYYCVIETWKWVRNHTKGKSQRAVKQAAARGRIVPKLSFYESVGYVPYKEST
jgi:hypothetical protein